MWSARWDDLYSRVLKVSGFMNEYNRSSAIAYAEDSKCSQAEEDIKRFNGMLLKTKGKSTEEADRIHRSEDGLSKAQLIRKLESANSALEKARGSHDKASNAAVSPALTAKMLNSDLRRYVNWFLRAEGHDLLKADAGLRGDAVMSAINRPAGLPAEVHIYFAPRSTLPSRDSFLVCKNQLHGHVVITRSEMAYYRKYADKDRAKYHQDQMFPEVTYELRAG